MFQYGIVANAQKLIVWLNSGEKVYYELNTMPKTTFTESNIVISTTDASVVYPISDIKKYTFESSNSSMQNIEGNKDIHVSQNGNIVTIANLKEGSSVKVYSVDGIMVSNYVARANESLKITLSKFPVGVYLIRTNNITYKITKR